MSNAAECAWDIADKLENTDKKRAGLYRDVGDAYADIDRSIKEMKKLLEGF